MFHSWAYRLAVGFLLVVAFMSLAFVGQSRLVVTAEAVSFRQGSFPIRARMRVSEIEEMVVAADGITLIGDDNALWIHWGGSTRDSEFLDAVVPYQLLRLARYKRAGTVTG